MRAKIVLNEQLKYIGESDHTQKAIDVFGTTYYKTRAGFMLKNGRLLDLTYGGSPREDHRNIQDAFDDMDLETDSDYLIEFMNEGNIRLIPEIPGIDIVKEPTEDQWKCLENYISYMVGRSHYFMVQFSNKNGQQVDWKEYEGFGTTEEIILDLHDYFNDNITESWQDNELSWSIHEPQTVFELLNTDTLYHATYKPYWEEIKKSGFILPGKHSNWSNIFKTYRYIYLSTDYDNAYSYAETAEDVPEELLDQIVVLEIDANKLDVDSLSADENQIYDSDEDEGKSIEDPLTWIELEYSKPIPVSAIRKVHDESELNENLQIQTLQKATPYMLRNDGELFECDKYHPYICNIYDIKNDLESLINERIDELYWFFNHTNNKEIKEYIQIIVKSSCKFQLVYLDTLENLYSKFKVVEDTYSCVDEKELYSILEWTNAETNQEFCRVRTSNIKFGGNSNDIYFRISSIGFNWFPLIWNIVYKNREYITTITISRDGSVRDFNQKECYKIKGLQIDHLPIEQFLMLTGNPILENFSTSLPILAKAYPTLKLGKALSEAYPNQHPRTIIGYYRRQIKEELSFDLNNILMSNDSSQLKEGYLDPEEKFYDYRTGKVDLKSCDIFDKTKTGFSFYNNLIDDPEYMKKSKGLVGSIIMMTPNEYFEHCGEIFHTSKQTQIDHTLADKDNIEYLKQVILKYNRKFPIGYLNIRDKQQEGRHRMAVAGELCGYNTPQPVLIVQDVNNILYPNELILKEDYYNKIDLSSNISDDDILKNLKTKFKVFDNISDISYGGYYILPSGEFLQAQNHLDIDKWLMQQGYIKKQSTDFADGSQFLEIKLNCIRVRCRGGKDDWIEPYVVLPKNRLTISQKYSLLAWLDFVLTHKERVLVHTETNGKFISYNAKDYISDEIIARINRYYTTGQLLN